MHCLTGSRGVAYCAGFGALSFDAMPLGFMKRARLAHFLGVVNFANVMQDNTHPNKILADRDALTFQLR